MTAPNESFAATNPTSKSAGNQKYGCAYQCSLFLSFVVKYSYAPIVLVPSNGEIATPVIFVIAFAASSIFSGGGGVAVSARPAGINDRKAPPISKQKPGFI